MSQPTAQHQLMDRAEQALGTHDVGWDDREAIQLGLSRAGGLGSATWNDLDPETKAAIERVEALPPTSWEDPSDVPDDLDED